MHDKINKQTETKTKTHNLGLFFFHQVEIYKLTCKIMESELQLKSYTYFQGLGIKWYWKTNGDIRSGICCTFSVHASVLFLKDVSFSFSETATCWNVFSAHLHLRISHSFWQRNAYWQSCRYVLTSKIY